MSHRISRVIIALVLMGLFGSRLWAQQEVVVTIEGLCAGDKLAHFTRGEELRTQMRFREAIEEYKMVIAPGEWCGKEPEAHYNIGLCYTWLSELDNAADAFYEVIKTYPDDDQAIGYSEFCLAWIDVQRKNYNNAVVRLQQTLAKEIDDMELCANIQFEIGRIYSLYLLNYDRAREAFQKVLELYPNSKMAEHPWLKNLKGKN